MSGGAAPYVRRMRYKSLRIGELAHGGCLWSIAVATLGPDLGNDSGPKR